MKKFRSFKVLIGDAVNEMYVCVDDGAERVAGTTSYAMFEDETSLVLRCDLESPPGEAVCDVVLPWE